MNLVANFSILMGVFFLGVVGGAALGDNNPSATKIIASILGSVALIIYGILLQWMAKTHA